MLLVVLTIVQLLYLQILLKFLSDSSFLSIYENCFSSSPLQFGFKSGSSATLCTGTAKNVVSRYIHNGTSVFGCFLDAFDLVDHDILFNILLDRGLPVVVVRFLRFWYSRQQLCVRWNSSLSVPFSVSNGVRQGSILSPFLFSVYVEGLLVELSKSGVGCFGVSGHCGHLIFG